MDKKRVLHIAQSNGGVERYLKMFFKYFQGERYENILIASQDYLDVIEDFEALGIKVYIIGMVRNISPYKDLMSLLRILITVKRIKVDIIYCHSSKAGVYGRIVAQILKIRCIYNPHGWAFDMNISSLKKFLFIYIEKFLSIFTDYIIAISSYEKNIAIKNRVLKEDKIIVIENGIDLENIETMNKIEDSDDILSEIGWSKDDIIIGMAARISEQKSPKTFVNIATSLCNKFENIKFIIVGDGEQRQEIERIVKDRNLTEKFYITGWVKNPIPYMKIFNVALLTSKWEGFGLVIPEYMALGKPVIASNIGGIQTIINNNKTGFLINDLNEESFINKIIYLLDNQEERNLIIKNAEKEVRNRFNFNRVIKEHIKIFNQIL